MPEAVIVATGRTPIGRANKGSLVECRPDDLSALVITSVLEKLPQLPKGEVEDVLLGCGQPAGEAGYNVARVAAILSGLDDVPGVTVNRYCSSSLQTIRMAAHAIRAGEGDVFVAAGVETVSRYMNGASDTGPHNPEFAEAEQRAKMRAPAVTVPPSRKTGLRLASPSSVVLGRGPSSLATTVPSESVTGMISRSKKPFSCDSTARVCDSRANSSISCRVIFSYSATFSAVWPIAM